MTEDEEQSKPFKPQVYQSNKGRRQIGVDIKEEVVPIMCIGGTQCMIRTLEVG